MQDTPVFDGEFHTDVPAEEAQAATEWDNMTPLQLAEYAAAQLSKGVTANQVDQIKNRRRGSGNKAAAAAKRKEKKEQKEKEKKEKEKGQKKKRGRPPGARNKKPRNTA